jgi:hypothetical protein
MELHDARPAKKFAHPRPMIECAQCGEPLYLPEWSEYLAGGGVRHLWRCEACDYVFETTVRFAAA